MALIDDPKAWILRMFEMEIREGRGEFCETFPSGNKLNDFEMEQDEFIFGTYKNKYFFSPLALYVSSSNEKHKIPWKAISKCSTSHGDGRKNSILTMTNGDEIPIKVSDFVKGHSGRISQLYHQMIEKWGCKPSFDTCLLSTNEFFNCEIDKYSIAPNLEPHPELDEFKRVLNETLSLKEVNDLYINVIDFEGDSPISDSIAIVSNSPREKFEELAVKLNASGVIDASKSIINFLNRPSENIWLIVWD